MDPFIGEITMLGFTFPPQDWALCDGQLIPISQNAALYSVIGDTYAEDGNFNNIKLPDLRQRVPLHQGQGLGLYPWQIGQLYGDHSIALNVEQTEHKHSIQAYDRVGDTAVPTADTFLARDKGNQEQNVFFMGEGEPSAINTMHTSTIQPSGSGQPHENRQPFLAVNFSIALIGIYPSRN